MEKESKYQWTFEIFFLSLILLWIIASIYMVVFADNFVTLHTTDKRGLHSVVYRTNGEAKALDFLTDYQYDSLKQALKDIP